MTLARGRAVIDAEIDALAAMRDRLDERFVEALDAILARRGRVVAVGIGKAGLIARKIAATLASTGQPSLFMHPADALHGDLGMLAADDVALCLSNSGESEEIVRLLPSLKLLGLFVIGVTGRERSTLGVQADLTLCIGEIDEPCPLGMAPTATTTALLALGDALALALMERRGFRIEDYARYHPAGALGRKALPIDGAMRRGEHLARVTPDRTVADAVFAITRARAGAAAVVDERGTLLGIFCDGDLRRGFATDPDLLTRRIADVMVADCARVLAGTRTVDVLDLMRERRIAEVPVVDADGRLVGMADLKTLVSGS